MFASSLIKCNSFFPFICQTIFCVKVRVIEREEVNEGLARKSDIDSCLPLDNSKSTSSRNNKSIYWVTLCVCIGSYTMFSYDIHRCLCHGVFFSCLTVVCCSGRNVMWRRSRHMQSTDGVSHIILKIDWCIERWFQVVYTCGFRHVILYSFYSSAIFHVCIADLMCW